MDTERIIILGNGGAAINAARAARNSGFSKKIHMISDVDTPAFNPMLSPYYLKGAIPWENCFPFGQGLYAEYDITPHFGIPVESLDPINQEIKLAGGENLHYGKCLVATGASPIIPPIPGLGDSSRAYPLRTAASVKHLENAILFAKKVIVLGASLVGLKVAEVLAKRGVRVILLDVVDQVLPRGAHHSSAAYLREYFEEHGIDVRLGCTLTGMEGDPEGVTCHFPDDIIEEADFVTVCTGVRPNVDFIDPGLVNIEQAVLVDERMQTNMQNLYAAGDVCQGYNLFSGKKEWLGTWGNACRQGRIAGCNMAGKDALYSGSIPENISPFFDWTYAQLGDVQTQRDDVRCIVSGDARKEGHCVLAFEGDTLVGVNLINCTYLAGKFRQAIARRLHWGLNLEQFDRYCTVNRIRNILNRITDTVCTRQMYPDVHRNMKKKSR
ncbi:MAG: NAD(P)/FAD-dependent oxidoreductase [Deltaproteobacteria bacterium]|nr:NAD(P)/FAD-dependent oxidoreductase [Deltaproteobacteria bacterium]